MTAGKKHAAIFVLSMLLTVGLIAGTARAAPPTAPQLQTQSKPKPAPIAESEQSTPVNRAITVKPDGNMDHVVGEELC